MSIAPPTPAGTWDSTAPAGPPRAARWTPTAALAPRRQFPSLILILTLTAGVLCSGCATAPPGATGAAEPPPRAAAPAPRGPVAEARPAPGLASPTPEFVRDPFPAREQGSPGFFARLGRAAKDALFDPETWAPAAGAALIGAAGVDRTISDWAAENAPVFGSEERAQRASDQLLRASEYYLIGTTLARTYDPDPLVWATLGGQSALMVTGITGTARTLTAGLKSATDRERPDGSDFRSFPSGHAANAVSRATLARRDLARMDLAPAPRWVLQAGATTLAAGVAWARVEARKHYASDVLIGWSVGHFVGSVLSDAWLGPVKKRGVDLSFGPTGKGGYGVRMGLKF